MTIFNFWVFQNNTISVKFHTTQTTYLSQFDLDFVFKFSERNIISLSFYDLLIIICLFHLSHDVGIVAATCRSRVWKFGKSQFQQWDIFLVVYIHVFKFLFFIFRYFLTIFTCSKTYRQVTLHHKFDNGRFLL